MLGPRVGVAAAVPAGVAADEAAAVDVAAEGVPPVLGACVAVVAGCNLAVGVDVVGCVAVADLADGCVLAVLGDDAAHDGVVLDAVGTGVAGVSGVEAVAAASQPVHPVVGPATVDAVVAVVVYDVAHDVVDVDVAVAVAVADAAAADADAVGCAAVVAHHIGLVADVVVVGAAEVADVAGGSQHVQHDVGPAADGVAAVLALVAHL